MSHLDLLINAPSFLSSYHPTMSMTTSSSSSSGTGSGSRSRGASGSRPRRSLPAPVPAVRGWIPSSSNHLSTTVSFGIGSDTRPISSSPRCRTGLEFEKGKGKEKEGNPGSGLEERLSSTPPFLSSSVNSAERFRIQECATRRYFDLDYDQYKYEC